MTNRTSQQRRAVARVAGLAIWVAIVSAFFLWQASKYEGVMSLMGEWQFNAFGRHYATFNYLLLVALLCLPGYLLFLRPGRRGATDRPETVLFRSARTFLKALFAGAAALASVALLMLLMLLMLPSDKGPLQRVNLASPALTSPREGLTELSGTIIYERTAGFDEDLLLARRTFRFAPVVGPRQGANDLQFFIQFPPNDTRAGASTVAMTGVLKRNGLPGEIVRLFRYAGYNVDEPHYVLFAEPSAMRWPYLTTAAQLLIGGALVLLLALLQRQRVRRIDHRVHAKADA